MKTLYAFIVNLDCRCNPIYQLYCSPIKENICHCGFRKKYIVVNIIPQSKASSSNLFLGAQCTGLHFSIST